MRDAVPDAQPERGARSDLVLRPTLDVAITACVHMLRSSVARLARLAARHAGRALPFRKPIALPRAAPDENLSTASKLAVVGIAFALLRDALVLHVIE